MIDWFAGAVASMSAAKDISQSLVTLRDGEMIRSKVFELTNSLMELQQQLMNAQVEQMNLVKQVGELQTALSNAQSREDSRTRYQLHQFPMGNFAYALKPEFQGSEPEHFLCSNCFDKGDKVTLQKAFGMGWAGFECPRCKTKVPAFEREIVF